LPFYRQKFLTLGHENLPGEKAAEASRQLFEISFPELAVTSPRHLISILRHKRVNELRTLVQEAADGRTVFDEDFARSVFREVIGTERTMARRRRIMSYVTAPLGFIPVVGNVAQIAVQEIADTVLQNRLTKKYRWFYMLSDLAESSTSD
jgi:hypothetical protein